MLGAASRMATFYFASCLGGALFIKCRLAFSPPQPRLEKKDGFTLSPLWSRGLADKQIVWEVIIRQDSTRHWMLEGHRTHAPQEFPLRFYGASFLKRLPTVKQDELWIYASCRNTHTHTQSCYWLHVFRVQNRNKYTKLLTGTVCLGLFGVIKGELTTCAKNKKK